MEELTDIVAIDGPAGAGKSTVSHAVAERLGFQYLDTGAMYRAATWWALHARTNMHDTNAIIECMRSLSLTMTETSGHLRVRVDGHDITDEIRSPEVTESIRKLDAIPDVRNQLTQMQRQIASQGPTVAEGRDMGTVVFPRAKSKFYLTASIRIRAERRSRDLAAKGYNTDVDALQAEIRRRDENDASRKTAPLKMAEDAHPIDTTHMTVDEVVETIVLQARKDFGKCTH